MHRRYRYVLFLSVFALVMTLPTPGKADVTFNLTVGINGATPLDPLPWLTATFHDQAAGVVRLTMKNNLAPGEFVRTWLFNEDVINLVLPDLTYVSGPLPNPIVLQNCCNGANDIKAGLFDIDFVFGTANNANRFDGGETSVWDFNAPGLTASDFKALSSNPDVGGPYYSAAKVQGLNPTGSSGSIGAIDPVPEPTSVLLLMTAVSLTGLTLRRKFAALSRR
jgi:hypothetical protein